MTSDLVPRSAPIPGGGRCDVCGRRSFRRLARLDLYRHVGCEPDERHLRGVEVAARAHARLLDALPAREEVEQLRLADVVELPRPANGTDDRPER
jgi:hypothetical protein